MPTILVFGSINVDLVARVAAIPRPGETVLAPSYETVCGGKGANQAVAAARMAAPGTAVAMVGRVGEDAFGSVVLGNLRRNGIETAGVAAGPEPTGCAFISVDGRGENAITVASGANGVLSADAVPAELIGPDTVAVLQMEVPFEASLQVARRTRDAGGRVLWSYAPAPAGFPPEKLRALLGASDVFIANEHEAMAAAGLLGHEAATSPEASAWLARATGATVILTAGADGAFAFLPDGSEETAPALEIEPVDTTGAGDTFAGILAAELAAGSALPEGLRSACIGASLACLAAGAQTAMPRRAEIERLLTRSPDR